MRTQLDQLRAQGLPAALALLALTGSAYTCFEGGESGDGGNGGGTGGSGSGSGGKTVDWETYQRVVTAKNNLESQVTDLKGQVGTLTEKTANYDTLAGQLREATGKAEAAESRYRRYKDVSSALGTTEPDIIETFESKYARLPEEGRPELGDWIKGLKEKPDEAPASLRPFLGVDLGGGGGGGGGGQRQRPKAVGGGGQPPGSGGQLDMDALKAKVAEAQRTGNVSELRKLRKHWRPEKAG